jgi:glucose/arabinose dehydrogenase
MPGRILLSAMAIVAILAALLWWTAGPFDGPSRAAPGDRLETLLQDRIKLPGGYRLEVFAHGLGKPRLMQMTESGDLIVSGYRHGTIMLIEADRNGDGRSDRQTILRDGLNAPHGLVLEGQALLVAEEHRVVSYDFDGTAVSNEQLILEGVPVDGNHTSRTLKRGPDGFLYLAAGSSCDSCIEDHPWRAAIIRFKEGAVPEVFASGLRNTVGFDWHPRTNALFGVDNGRDNLGDDIPDDEVNRIERGRHYGWPYVHGNDVKDPDLFSSMPQGLVTLPQTHGLGAHVAPLSIVFLKHQSDPGQNGTALVAEHGSWNRTEKSGYRIVRLTFEGNYVREEIFMSGCEVNEDVICRPVDILEAPDGSLYVTDDYTGAIYRITRSSA